MQKYGTKYTMQRTLVYSMRAETRRQSITSSELSCEHVCQDALCLCKSEKGSRIFFWGGAALLAYGGSQARVESEL